MTKDSKYFRAKLAQIGWEFVNTPSFDIKQPEYIQVWDFMKRLDESIDRLQSLEDMKKNRDNPLAGIES